MGTTATVHWSIKELYCEFTIVLQANLFILIKTNIYISMQHLNNTKYILISFIELM